MHVLEGLSAVQSTIKGEDPHVIQENVREAALR